MIWVFLQTLRGWFSAVSTPIFSSKYSLESSWRDLQDLHTLHRSDLKIAAKSRQHFFANEQMNFRFFHFLRQILHFVCEFFMKFCPDFATNSRKEWYVSLFQSNLRKQIRKLPKCLKSAKIIQYSPFSQSSFQTVYQFFRKICCFFA